jgi:hypothetical protein
VRSPDARIVFVRRVRVRSEFDHVSTDTSTRHRLSSLIWSSLIRVVQPTARNQWKILHTAAEDRCPRVEKAADRAVLEDRRWRARKIAGQAGGAHVKFAR